MTDWAALIAEHGPRVWFHPTVTRMKFTLSDFEWDPKLQGDKSCDELFEPKTGLAASRMFLQPSINPLGSIPKCN